MVVYRIPNLRYVDLVDYTVPKKVGHILKVELGVEQGERKH